MKIPKIYMQLRDLAKKLDKFEICEHDILQMAAAGKATLSVWFEGNISSTVNGIKTKIIYNNFANLSSNDALKFTFENQIYIKNLSNINGQKFSIICAEKEGKEFNIEDLLILEKEIEKLEKYFELQEENKKKTGSKTNEYLNQKREKTLLKIIGALLFIHYSKPPYYQNKKYNASSIEDHILNQLIGSDWVASGTIRKKVKEAMGEINEILLLANEERITSLIKQ